MKKSVHNIPSYEEYFGINDNVLEDEEFESSEKDDELKKIVTIMLALLQEFYILHMYDEAYYYASEEFKEDIDRFSTELKDNLLVLFTDLVHNISAEYAVQWTIPLDTVAIPLELIELVSSGIDAVTNTLYYDLKDNAIFYTDLSIISGVFSPHGSFRRAVKKLTNEITFKGGHIRKIIKRKYDEFVYGQEALFTWHCSGRNTCEWCYSIEAMGAMPLSWFPIDHVNGACVLKPVNPNEYSDEYKLIRGWM